jgi:hypothetical protein
MRANFVRLPYQIYGAWRFPYYYIDAGLETPVISAAACRLRKYTQRQGISHRYAPPPSVRVLGRAANLGA